MKEDFEIAENRDHEKLQHAFNLWQHEEYESINLFLKESSNTEVMKYDLSCIIKSFQLH